MRRLSKTLEEQVAYLEDQQGKPMTVEGEAQVDAIPVDDAYAELGEEIANFCDDFPACSKEAETILYAGDNTISVHSKVADDLQIKREADRSVQWTDENRMVCTGPKTKLLILGTHQIRRKVMNEFDLVINICQNAVR